MKTNYPVIVTDHKGAGRTPLIPESPGLEPVIQAGFSAIEKVYRMRGIDWLDR
ncbi:hypothetical protein BH24CHL3_BH24CHL3_07800 [soil metagenome]